MSLNRKGEIRRRWRAEMFMTQKGGCYWCGRPMLLLNDMPKAHHQRAIMATFDHVVPRSLGGSDRRENLVLACRECNNKRSSKPGHVFLQEVAA